MKEDYKRLARAFDKSDVANFPSHEGKTRENTRDSSIANWQDLYQPLYGMPMDTYPRQPQAYAQIRGKSTDLRTVGPSVPEFGPSGVVVVGPIF
jgi:hypothetical protein